MSNDTRKFPGLFGWLALLLLGGSIYLGWWLTRPTADMTGSQLGAEDLEVACTGRVDSFERQFALEPEVMGKVLTVFVGDNAPNNQVKAGEKILEIDPRFYQIKVIEAEKAVEAAKIEVEKAAEDEKAFPIQLAARKEALSAAAANVASAEINIELLKESDKQTRKEGDKPGKIYLLQLRLLEERVVGLKALEAVEQKQVELIEMTGQKSYAMALHLAQVRFQAASAALDEATKARDDCTLKAPADGTILQFNVSKGSIIGMASPLPNIVFAPAGPLVVRADLEQEYVGRVAAGMTVELRDEARSTSPLWTGKIVTISDYIARKRNVLLDPGEMNDVRTAECVIAIDPSKDSLRIGQRMRVRIQTR